MTSNHFGIYNLHCLHNLGTIVPGYVHNNMNQTQLLYHFQKGKDLKLENKLRWHATIAQDLWFNHILDLYNIFL
jgi:hypothetical protein